MKTNIFVIIAIACFAFAVIVIIKNFIDNAKAQERERKHQIEEAERQHSADMERKRREQEKEDAIRRAIAANPGSVIYRVSQAETYVNHVRLNVSEFLPLSKKRYVAFDLETTGLNSDDDAIVEIGAVKVENGVIVDEYAQLIDPERPMPYSASKINNIYDDMLQGKPKIYEALPEFLAFVGDDVLAAHNAAFDIHFLDQACMRSRFKPPEKFFDTMALARYWPEAENKKLATLLFEAGIENDDAHRALGDARAVAALIDAANEKRMKK